MPQLSSKYLQLVQAVGRPNNRSSSTQKPSLMPQNTNKYLQTVGRQHFGGGPIDGDCVDDGWTWSKPCHQSVTMQRQITCQSTPSLKLKPNVPNTL